MRMAIESGRKLQEAEASEDIGLTEESMFPMYFKVLDKTSEEMRLVTGRLHGFMAFRVKLSKGPHSRKVIGKSWFEPFVCHHSTFSPEGFQMEKGSGTRMPRQQG